MLIDLTLKHPSMEKEIIIIGHHRYINKNFIQHQDQYTVLQVPRMPNIPNMKKENLYQTLKYLIFRHIIHHITINHHIRKQVFLRQYQITFLNLMCQAIKNRIINLFMYLLFLRLDMDNCQIPILLKNLFVFCKKV